MDTISEALREQIASDFESLLKQELNRRHIPYWKIETRDIGGVNLDVYVYVTREPFYYHFKYLGWGWLIERKLTEMSLETFVKWYVELYLREMRQQYEYELKEANHTLERRDSWPHHIETARQRKTISEDILNSLKYVVD